MRGLVRYTRPNDLFDWSSMLDNFFEGEPVWNTRCPAVDVREDEDGYRMEAEIPGLTDKDIDLKIEDNILTLSSRKDEAGEEKKDGYLIRERRSAEFCRTFVLPKDVNRDQIKAEFENGLLVVTLPKAPEAKPRKIDVKVNG
ncbi:MAG: Hsp20/alpha crystallin family protein [Spirochaetales bacterium]|nr:Hsp20/alpha crystallin family protein [Spirochaetales bacterium]